MYAAITQVQVHLDKVDEATDIWQNSVVPEVSQAQGYQGGYLFTDYPTGSAYVVFIYETEADANAVESSGLVRQQIAKLAPLMTAPPVRKVYKVSGQA